MIIDIPNNENDVKNIIWQAPSAWPKEIRRSGRNGGSGGKI
jgi:hypothetical protein